VPSAALDPIIHQPARLQLMALLHRNRQAAARWLRETLQLTDGNLGSHAARLVAAGYVVEGRVLTAKGFELRYRITPTGDAAFQEYLRALRQLLAEVDEPPGPPRIHALTQAGSSAGPT
jgi:DNA-binding MarR family transcriptional regulator